MSKIANMLAGLDAAEREEMKKALGIEDVGLSERELDVALAELKKGHTAGTDLSDASEMAQVDVTGFLGATVEALQKGHGALHEAQNVLAGGMAVVGEAVREMLSELKETRAEIAELSKGLGQPQRRRSVQPGEALPPPGEGMDKNWSIDDFTTAAIKAMGSETDVNRRSALRNAVSAAETGSQITDKTWAQLGLTAPTAH